MREALATLPWVEKGSTKIDSSRRLVRVTVTDKSLYKLDDLNAALTAKGASYRAQDVRGPTDS